MTGRPLGSKPITEEMYFSLAQKHGIEFIGPFPQTTNHKTNWRCPQGHEWKTTYRTLFRLTRSGCKKCSYKLIRSKFSQTDYENKAIEYGHTFLGPVPRSCAIKTNWRCKNGHVWKKSIRDLRGCHLCQRLPESEYISAGLDRGIIWLGPAVNSVDDLTNWECSQGHKFQRSQYHMAKGHSCDFCIGRAPKVLADYIEIGKLRGMELIGDIPKNSMTKATWKCSNGHITHKPYNSMRTGGCGECRPQYQSGENNPLWKGGVTQYRETEEAKIKKIVRHRDGRICQICFRKKCRGERQLDVHHIIPARLAILKHRNTLRNLITLCRQHHKDSDMDLLTSIPQLRDILSRKYGYKYSDFVISDTDIGEYINQ